jgi:hypothetical protein
MVSWFQMCIQSPVAIDALTDLYLNLCYKLLTDATNGRHASELEVAAAMSWVTSRHPADRRFLRCTRLPKSA